MRQYLELRRLTPAGIKAMPLPVAAPVLNALAGDGVEPSRALDLALLEASQAGADPLPLLCLRCRISHALEAWLLATHRTHREQHGIELEVMASYALDDDGALTIRTGKESATAFVLADLAALPDRLLSPFSADVLRSYNPALCGLGHWSRLRIQAHHELKGYLRQHGLLLISDWALLRNSSASRVRQACLEQLSSADTIESLCELHHRYGPLYDAAKQRYKARSGKAAGWQPDLPFLRQLAPEQEPFATLDQLRAIARAVRLLLTSTSISRSRREPAELREPLAPSSLSDGAEADSYSAAELRELIDAALQRALDQHMPAVLASSGKDGPLLRCLWAGWTDGLRQRPLAERCRTSQGTVSKKLQPEMHASAIATAAAVELRRHPAFACCGRSVEAAERLVAALRNHLLEPEQEAGIAPLRQWVRNHLSEP